MGMDDSVLAKVPSRMRVASHPLHPAPTCFHHRVQVDGKALKCNGQRYHVHGVTYGPFAPNPSGEPFPALHVVHEDFAAMRAAGINSIRTYHSPPRSLLEYADETGIGVLVDAPWSKHLCFLDDVAFQREARESVAKIATHCRDHSCLLAYSIGNEIPPDVVRWYGAKRIHRFLAELADTVRQADPRALVTYANYPPTEYLELPFLDFVTFNVYLHDREVFRRYLNRLQNLVGDKPLLLGELGLDTIRHGEAQQAEFLAGHLREVALLGLAGAFVFSWTDDWHTGGFAVEDWAFGITHCDRFPKASLLALQELFGSRLTELLPEVPRVSIIVCTYNGGATLEQCIRSLMAVEYPDYEIIVVNDGSTDDTRSILAKFPDLCVLHQENLGLSAARNAGLRAATGSVVAYTDSDCFVDPHWITHLVYQFKYTDAAAVGGPNLTPEDGWLAACVAAAPGQPTHVLESDHVAEHIPGCNMAFRREALQAIDGFEVQYRKAGDDVDVCWRLQHAGFWITFAPGAFVWHHRRQNPAAYFRQQAGYGEAEALVRFAHPHRFNGRGDGKWRGILYGSSLRGLQLKRANIHRGVFAGGMFQTLYSPGPAYWAMLPNTLEWHIAMCLVAVTSLVWLPAGWIAGIMILLSLLVASLQSAQARLTPCHDNFHARLVLMWLCFAQPIVRSWSRYRTRYFARRASRLKVVLRQPQNRFPWTGRRTAAYWSENGTGRMELLGVAIAYLKEHHWGKTIDTGWQEWDLEIDGPSGTVVQVCTVQEELGSGRRRLLTRFRLKLRGHVRLMLGIAGAAGLSVAVHQPWQSAVALAGLGFLGAIAWYRGVRAAGDAMDVFDTVARTLELLRCDVLSANVHQSEETAPHPAQASSPTLHHEPPLPFGEDVLPALNLTSRPAKDCA